MLETYPHVQVVNFQSLKATSSTPEMAGAGVAPD